MILSVFKVLYVKVQLLVGNRSENILTLNKCAGFYISIILDICHCSYVLLFEAVILVCLPLLYIRISLTCYEIQTAWRI